MKLLTKIFHISLYVMTAIVGLCYMFIYIYQETNIQTTKDIIELTYSNGDKDTIKAPFTCLALYKGDLRYNDGLHNLTIASSVRTYKIVK